MIGQRPAASTARRTRAGGENDRQKPVRQSVSLSISQPAHRLIDPVSARTEARWPSKPYRIVSRQEGQLFILFSPFHSETELSNAREIRCTGQTRHCEAAGRRREKERRRSPMLVFACPSTFEPATGSEGLGLSPVCPWPCVPALSYKPSLPSFKSARVVD